MQGLVGSWQALAAPNASAEVLHAAGFVAFRHPDPVLCNAILLSPSGLASTEEVLEGVSAYPIWCWSDDSEAAATLEAARYRRDITTVPMPGDLRGVDARDWVLDTVGDAAGVDELNGLDQSLVRDVPGLRPWLTVDGAAASW